MFLPLLRPKQDVGIIDVRPTQGDGFTCGKCGRGNATRVCPFDGQISGGGRAHAPFVPKGTIPFRPHD